MIFFKLSKGFEENIRVKLSGNDVKITKHRRIIHDKSLYDPKKLMRTRCEEAHYLN